MNKNNAIIRSAKNIEKSPPSKPSDSGRETEGTPETTAFTKKTAINAKSTINMIIVKKNE